MRFCPFYRAFSRNSPAQHRDCVATQCIHGTDKVLSFHRTLACDVLQRLQDLSGFGLIGAWPSGFQGFVGFRPVLDRTEWNIPARSCAMCVLPALFASRSLYFVVRYISTGQIRNKVQCGRRGGAQVLEQ